MLARGEKHGVVWRRGARLTFVVGSLGACIGAFAYVVVPLVHPVTYTASRSAEATLVGNVRPATTSGAMVPVPPLGELASTTEVASHVATPRTVKALYMTQCVVGTPPFRAELVDLVKATELNTIIIDLKDYTGRLSFPTDDPSLRDSVSSQCGARDMRAFVEKLHEQGIYVVGRITVFQDPFYTHLHPELAVKFRDPPGTVWKDRKGLSFIDVGAKPYWEYIAKISRAARELGFDELNYDYVRFPSDGPMGNISFDWAKDRPKAEVLEEFFAYLQAEVKRADAYPSGETPPALSVDIFGMVTTAEDDMNIGQMLERALPYFDYVCPMVYPSHYPPHFNGWADPNTVPYDLIHFVLASAVRRAQATSSPVAWLGGEQVYRDELVAPHGSSTASTTRRVATGLYTKPSFGADHIRPWLQDFDYGGTYDVKEVRAQIKATHDVGITSWMLWAPSNRYTQGALEAP